MSNSKTDNNLIGECYSLSGSELVVKPDLIIVKVVSTRTGEKQDWRSRMLVPLYRWSSPLTVGEYFPSQICSRSQAPSFLTGIILSAIVPHNSWISSPLSWCYNILSFFCFSFYLLKPWDCDHRVSRDFSILVTKCCCKFLQFRQKSKIQNLNLDFILGFKNKVSNLYIFVNLLWL